MKQSKVIESDFTMSLERMKDNTLNFENCALLESYISETASKGSTTCLGLLLHDNVIINTIIPYLRDNSNYKAYSTDQAEFYRCRPMQLSNDEYGCTDYWYIILAVNDYSSPYDFKNFTKLIIPKASDIEDLLNKETYKNRNIGVANL